MRNFIKFLSVLGAVVCTLIFVLIYFAQTTIPEKVTIVEKTGYNMPKIFGFDLFNISSKINLDVLRNNKETFEQKAEVELLNIIPVKNIKITNSKRKYVVPGGEIFGIKLYTDGIIIVDTDVVETEIIIKIDELTGEATPKIFTISEGDTIKVHYPLFIQMYSLDIGTYNMKAFYSKDEAKEEIIVEDVFTIEYC